MAAYAETASAAAPEWGARLSAARGRVAQVGSEPGPWIGTGLVLLAAVVVAHNPIARLLGTDQQALTDTTATPPVATGSAPETAAAATLPDSLLKPVPTHAPVDPFQPLVSAAGGLTARSVITLPHRAHASSSSSGAGSSAGHGAPAATRHQVTYRVKAGDTLWSIASKLHAESGGASWLRIYDANRSVIGSDPNVINTGVTLRVPKG